MSDVAITWNASQMEGVITFDPEKNDLNTDEGLTTAVLISLFTDARAKNDDELPDVSVESFPDRRGWWGDKTSELDNDSVGSRLWLLDRAKIQTEVLRQAEKYAKEALQWMIDENLAAKIDVLAEVGDNYSLSMKIEIHRISGDTTYFKFDSLWNATVAG